MLYELLNTSRLEVLECCRIKAGHRRAGTTPLKHIVSATPALMAYIEESLRRLAPQPSGDPADRLGLEATEVNFPPDLQWATREHGRDLLQSGATVQQVIGKYSDCCAAVAELAVKHKVEISAQEYLTINKCVADVAALAVEAYYGERDRVLMSAGNRAVGERLGALGDQLRTYLDMADVSLQAIKSGRVGLGGATSGVLDSSLAGLRRLIDRAVKENSGDNAPETRMRIVDLRHFVADVHMSALVEARLHGCKLLVFPVAADLAFRGDPYGLASALNNLLQNAFNHTARGQEVLLRAYGSDTQIVIEVEDQCGGLDSAQAASIQHGLQFLPIDQSDSSLGLSIARHAVETCGGCLYVQDLPGKGCKFSIELPRLNGTEVDATPGSAASTAETAACLDGVDQIAALSCNFESKRRG